MRVKRIIASILRANPVNWLLFTIYAFLALFFIVIFFYTMYAIIVEPTVVTRQWGIDSKQAPLVAIGLFVVGAVLLYVFYLALRRFYFFCEKWSATR